MVDTWCTLLTMTMIFFRLKKCNYLHNTCVQSWTTFVLLAIYDKNYWTENFPNKPQLINCEVLVVQKEQQIVTYRLVLLSFIDEKMKEEEKNLNWVIILYMYKNFKIYIYIYDRDHEDEKYNESQNCKFLTAIQSFECLLK